MQKKYGHIDLFAKKVRKSKLMVWGNNIYFVSNDKTA